jgi:ferrous iron transport protein B
MKEFTKSQRENPVIALVGNPNSGKTTVFNSLTGSHQRVGNWPGVTVERRSGTMFLTAPSLGMVTGTGADPAAPASVGTSSAENGGASRRARAVADLESITRTRQSRRENRLAVEVVDLPGIYSLSASSEDEMVARDFVLSRDYDLVVSIIDATNLERNLYLTLQLIELEIPVLVVLNMVDRADAAGITVDAAHLAVHLGCPVLPVTATSREGATAIGRAVHAALENPPHPEARITYPDGVETVIGAWKASLEPLRHTMGTPSRYAALRLLEGDTLLEGEVLRQGRLSPAALTETRRALEKELLEELDIVIADSRYGFIHGISRDVITRRVSRESITEKIDNVVMNRWLGVPVFLGAMYLVFWATISVGGAFIDFFDILFGTIFVDGAGHLLETAGAPIWLTGILADGIGAGIQTVATFIPIIFMMFFMLSLLEDSGYMARAAFVMDRVMRLVGLPGKSFVPMLVGFGCTVPAISGTRTLETKKDRFMTIFMAPFMSCGARLPVYALFAAALFPGRSGLVVFSLYVVGIILAMLTGLLLKFTLFGGEYSHFVMELPTYHMPRIPAILRSAGRRLRVFVIRAGVTITVVVTILAVLNSIGTDGTFGNEDTEKSVLSSLGRTVTPVFTPMGIEEDNWPATVGLFTGLFAKEAIVGTLSSLYSQNSAAEPAAGDDGFDLLGGIAEALATVPENLAGLVGSLADPLGVGLISDDADFVAGELEVENSVFAGMRNHFSGPGAYAYLLFVLIYFPCVAALGAAIREMGHGYGWLLVGYLTLLAWAVSTMVYQLASGPRMVPVVAAAGVLGLIVVTFGALRNRSRRAVTG